MDIKPELEKMLIKGYLEIYEKALERGGLSEIVDNTMSLTNDLAEYITKDIIKKVETENKLKIKKEKK